jgi:RHS repeat-associated protein
MRLPARLFVSVFALSVLFAAPSFAQVTTGTPPFGSFGGGPDVINLANLNSHLCIPVFHKAGRGTDFAYDLCYDSSIWTPVPSGTWLLPATMGWTTSLQAGGGFVSRTSSTSRFRTNCGPGASPQFATITTNTYSNWGYTDGRGTHHPFPTDTSTSELNGCTGDQTFTGFTDVAKDGSGYKLTVSGPTAQSVYTTDGGLVTFGVGILYQDRNGNQITSTNSSGVTSFYDTLSGTTPVLTVSGSGTSASPFTYTYTAPSGANATYTMKFTAYTVQTNFGCSGVAEYPATSQNLVSEIDLPDGSKYTFSYEPTPGISGSVTGRLASVTLPTGGSITYAYSGGNNGINCSDGSTATLTRTTPDGTWTYTSSKGTGAASSTTITAPQLPYDSAANQTVVNFQGIYETQRQVYQGSTSGTLLRQWSTCYNGNTSNCNGTAITLPITRRTVIDQYGASGLQCKHDYFYNTVGGLTEQDDYDYGSGAPGSLLRKTLVSFASLGNITAFRQTVTVQNGAGATVASTTYNYDEVAPTATSGIAQHTSVSGSRGNLTSINYPVSGITSHFTYYDTGSIKTSQDVNGATSTFNYSSTTASCQMAFPTSVSEPLSMSHSFAWNCTGGVQLTDTDENGQVTTATYNDANFWRPASVSFPDGGLTSVAYNSLTSTTVTTKMNASQSIVSTQLLDGLGRPLHGQLNSDPQGVDYTDTTYDALGRVASVSNPYRSTSDSTYGLTSYRYDALGRPTSVILPDGSVAATSYTNNTVTATDPAGKSRKTLYDSIGRLTQVFEDPAGLNYETDYAYDALGDLLCVGQKGTNSGTFTGCGSIPAGWRARSFTYDALSRLTGETTPEAGTVTYGYDASGHIGDLTSRVAPAPNQTGSATVTTAYSYDALHRLTQKSYSDGTTPTAIYYYDLATPWGTNYGGSYLGRLNQANTSNSAGLLTSSIFVYDPMGRVTMNGKCTPTNCALAGFHTSYSYDLAGDLTSYGTSENGITFSYEYDSAAHPIGLTSSLVDAQHPATLFTADASLGYFPHGALRKAALGNGLTATNAYNNRLQPCLFELNTSSVTLQSCNDSIPSGNVQYFWTGYNAGSTDNGNVAYWSGGGAQSFTRTYSYDSFNRLATLSDSNTSQSCRGLSWTYDAWGNRTAQSVTTGTCNTFSASADANNRLSGSPYQYDAAGNMIHDASHGYTYDAENRLIQVDGGSTAKYTYDALGIRVQKAIGSSIGQYVHDLNGRVILETDGNGNGGPIADYIYLAGRLVAEYENNTTYFAQGDHLGSTRIFSDPGGNASQSWDYLPFGEIIAGGSCCTTHRFTGDERDGETGLDDTQFRKYSSTLGRWMTPDPAGLAAVNPSSPQSWNRYSYVFNDPTVLTDPSGLCAQIRDADGNFRCYDTCPQCTTGGIFGWDEFDLLRLATTPTSGGDLLPNPRYWGTGPCPDDCLGVPPFFVDPFVYGNIGLLKLLGIRTMGAAGPPGWIPKGGPPSSGPYYLPKPTPPGEFPGPTGGSPTGWEPTPGTDWLQKSWFWLGRLAKEIAGSTSDIFIMIDPHTCVDGKRDMMGDPCRI